MSSLHLTYNLKNEEKTRNIQRHTKPIKPNSPNENNLLIRQANLRARDSQ